MPQNAVNQRIKKLRSHFKLTNEAFAESVGIKSMSTYNSRKKIDNTLLTVDELIIAHQIYKVRLNWLLLGEGEMIEGQITELTPDEEYQKGLENAMIQKRFAELVFIYQKRNKLQLNELAAKIKHSYTHMHAILMGKKALSLPIVTKSIITLDLDANFIFKGKVSQTI